MANQTIQTKWGVNILCYLTGVNGSENKYMF
jgi:hypothetical protein